MHLCSEIAVKHVGGHTNYTRNNMGQKCEGNCGLWVLNEIVKHKYSENLKKRGSHLGVTC